MICVAALSYLYQRRLIPTQRRFIKVNVENVPFLSVKLKIQVLPMLVCFIDGIVKDRVVGFEDFGGYPHDCCSYLSVLVLTIHTGNSDTFTTQQLEVRIARSAVIALAGQGESIAKKTVFGFAPAAAESDDDDE